MNLYELNKIKRQLEEHTSAPLSNPELVADMFKALAAELEVEAIFVLVLDTKNRMKATEIVSLGSINATIAYPREIYRRAVMQNAASIIVVHNHPSGDPTPGMQDIKLTRDLIASGEVLGIGFFDHIVVGKELPGRISYFFSIKRELDSAYKLKFK